MRHHANRRGSAAVIIIIVLLVLAVVLGGKRLWDEVSRLWNPVPQDQSPSSPDTKVQAPLFPSGTFKIDEYYNEQIKREPGLAKYKTGEYSDLLRKDYDTLRRENKEVLEADPLQSSQLYDDKVEGHFLRLAYLYNAVSSLEKDSKVKGKFERTIEASWEKIGWPRKDASNDVPKLTSFTYGSGYHPAYTQWYLLYCLTLDPSRELEYWKEGGLADQLLAKITEASKKWSKPEPTLTGHDYMDASVAALACYVLINLDLAADQAQGNVDTISIKDDRFNKIGDNLCSYFESSHPKVNSDVLGASYRRGSPETASLVGAKVLYFVMKGLLHKRKGEMKSYEQACTEAFSMICKLCAKDTSNSAYKGRPYYHQVMVDTYTAAYVIRAASLLTRHCMNEQNNDEIRKLSPLANMHAKEMIRFASGKEIKQIYTAYYGPLIRLAGLHELRSASTEARKYWDRTVQENQEK